MSLLGSMVIDKCSGDLSLRVATATQGFRSREKRPEAVPPGFIGDRQKKKNYHSGKNSPRQFISEQDRYVKCFLDKN